MYVWDRLDLFDLFEGLPSEVLGLQHLGFRLLSELTDVPDVRVLETVCRAHAQLQLINRSVEVRVQRRLDLDLLLLGLDVFIEVDKDLDLVLDNLGRQGDRVLRKNRAIGPDLKRQLVVVCTLADTRVGDAVVHLVDW